MRESSGSGIFASAVIDTFFGFSPSIRGDTMVADPTTPRPFTGRLKNVRFRQTTLTLEAGPAGVKMVIGSPSKPNLTKPSN
jgi:hypothetical protein